MNKLKTQNESLNFIVILPRAQTLFKFTRNSPGAVAPLEENLTRSPLKRTVFHTQILCGEDTWVPRLYDSTKRKNEIL